MKRKKLKYTYSNSSYGLAIILISIIVLLGFGSIKKNTFEPFTIPKIIGNNNKTNVCLSPMYMLNAWYNVERLDSITGIIDLSSPAKDDTELTYQFDLPTTVNHKKISNAGLQVIADTVNELSITKKPIWASYLFHRSFSDSIEILQDDTLIQHVKSFPIYIANLSTNEVASLQTQDGSIMMIVQAIDKTGKWKPIEYWSNSWCGNSYFTIMIPPRHMLMTRGIKCSGDFYTKCRMMVSNKRDSIFSNEFYMSINETQFEKPMRKNRDE